MLNNSSAHGVTGRGSPPGELFTFAKSLHAIGAKAKQKQSPSFQILKRRCSCFIARLAQRLGRQGAALSWRQPHKPPDRDDTSGLIADCGRSRVGSIDPLPPGLLHPDGIQDKA